MIRAKACDDARVRRLAASLSLLASCASPARPAVRATAPVDASVPRDAPAAADVPPPRPAHERVAEALVTAAVIPADEAAWLPSRVLGAVFDATGALPAPTPPRRSEDRVTWSLVAPPEVRALDGACEALARFDARLACAADTVTFAGADRPRLAVGWRAEDSSPTVTLAQPLRALARLGRNICLASAQRTLRTLDLTVRVDAPPALGRTLAMMATAPGLRDLILVRTEPRGAGLEAVLSWPIERVRDLPATMGDDPWPARCDGASSVGEGAPAGTLPTLRALIDGTAARGAVLASGRQEWVVTVGDRVAGTTVTRVEADRVELTLPGRPRAVVLRPPRPR